MFGRRFTILTFRGIKIGIDFSWFFIAILLTWTLADGFFPYRYPHLSTGIYWMMGVIGMLGLFICILLHELGHALVAKHYKLPVEHITLFLFGGVSEIKKEPKSPKVEFLMAGAGPLVSIILVVLMYIALLLEQKYNVSVIAIGITYYLVLINAIIVIFNLLPAFPLDGGRVFRSILWGWKKDLGWATKTAARVGVGFAFIMILAGVFFFIVGNFLGGIWLVILGWFLQRAASSSVMQFHIGNELKRITVSKFMTKDPIEVPPDITVRDFIDDYLYKSHHHLYPITEKNKLLGAISMREVKELSPEEWKKTTVKKAMAPLSQVESVSPNTSAKEALEHVQHMDIPTLLVVQDKRLVGIVTAQDLFRLIGMKLELEGK